MGNHTVPNKRLERSDLIMAHPKKEIKLDGQPDDFKIPEDFNFEISEIPDCCEHPHPWVVSPPQNCCAMLGCKNCKALWEERFVLGHDRDNHPLPPKPTQEEMKASRQKRRRARKTARKQHQSNGSEQDDKNEKERDREDPPGRESRETPEMDEDSPETDQSH